MNMQQLMRQAQEMQKKMLKQQEELAKKDFEATSGGGMVTARVSGAGHVLSLKINPEIVVKEDVDMLQDLIVVAINEGLKKVSEEAQGGMGGLANQMGIKLPGF